MFGIIFDNNFLGAFLQTLIIIALGYIFKQKQLISSDGKGVITTIVWKLAVPCMAFNAFMTDISYKNLISSLTVLCITFLMYMLFLLIGKLIFKRLGHTKSNICSLMFSVGQVTLFSMPILKSIYSDNPEKVMLSINVMTIAFRIMVYIVAFFMISGIKLNKENLFGSLKVIFINPIMIAMLSGMAIWALQGILPQISVQGESYAILRIDKTLPALYKTILSLDKLVGPLAMLLIGITLGEANLKDAFTDKLVWQVSFLRMVVAPIIVLLSVYIMNLIGFISLEGDAVMALVIGFAAPASVTLNIFSIQYHHEEQLSSRVCMLSTMMCIFTIPIIYAAVKALL